LNFTCPFFCVRFVTKGVPGRGLEDDLGVDSCTGIFAAGVPRTVTDTVAAVIDGFGVNEAEGDVVTLTPLL
jgi:hypothetical protein